MTDCPHTSKEAAVEMLAKRRVARADRPKEAFKKFEPAKKVGRVLVKAKNTSLAKMARMEGVLDGKTIMGALDTGATSSAFTRSFVTVRQDEGHLVSIQKMSEPFKYKLAHDVLYSMEQQQVRQSQKILRSLSYAASVQSGHHLMDHFACETQAF
jgi:hypothetical protein